MVKIILISFVLALWLCSSCTGYGNIFSNTWAVKVCGGHIVLGRLARKHGFVNETQVVSDYYIFDHEMVPVRSSSPSTHILENLLAEPEVLWTEQQVLRPYKLYSSVMFNDLRWNEQWYMNRTDGPTYNVLDVWKMGYTGKGVVVAVVDEGLEKDHRELKQNYDGEASFDFIENVTDPSPSNPVDSVSHGNNCAGVIAAVANNSYCGVGIAYSANISGIRILDGGLTDALKAKGLGFRQDYVDIYSNSWGPDDNGYEVAEVGTMTEEVIKKGALEGRNRLGSIFVFAAGNGGYADDCCSFNGLVNSIYTIAITGVNKDGSIPRYGERCAGILAVTYSREIFSLTDNVEVITASHYGECTSSFSASSAAAAMASGLIALALEANKNLTWRDVQHIIVRSSRADGRIIQEKDWVTNAANLTASNNVGFGLMDAYRMVSFAKSWTTVPPQLNCTIYHPQINSVIPSDFLKVNTSLDNLSQLCPGNNINFLEHVQVRVNLNYTRRGDLEIDLTSPRGTTSRLAHYRRNDNAPDGTYLTNWTILTLHHWGENPSGVWKLTLRNSQQEHNNTGLLFDWSLILYGTTLNPLEKNPHVTPVSPQPTEKTATTKSTTQPSKQSIRYFVRITFRTGYPPRGNDFRIQLFGVHGKTDERRLTPSENTQIEGSSQLYYIQDRPVGNLTKVALIQNRDPRYPRGYVWFLKEVGVRWEGNNPWIKLRYGRFIWSTAKVYIKRDINECNKNNGGCQQICTNMPGTYKCSCYPGYRTRSSDGRRCKDIDECNKNNGGCQQICTNMPGTYKCSCYPGYRIRSSDGRRCKAKSVPGVRSRPKSCKDVQQQNQSYVQNSEYLIYPVKECNVSIKVYCHHDTRTADPKEYITVDDGNYVLDWRGVTYFRGVRLVPDKMLIDRSDTRHATYYKAFRWYRQKKHHFASPSSYCERSHGRFSLNFSGTGLSFDQKWFIAPWISVVQRLKKSALYYVGCHHQRQCTVCEPKHDLVLTIDGC